MNKTRIYLLASAAALILVASFGFFTKKVITLELEGQSVEISTRALLVKGALGSAGITLQDEDVVNPGRNTFLKNGDVIRLSRASQVKIQVGDAEFTLTSIDRTPAEWLAEAGLSPAEKDRIFVNGQPALTDQNMVYLPEYHVTLKEAVQISLQTSDAQWDLESAAPTLGEALWEAGFVLTEADQLSPSPETPLIEPITVRLTPAREITVEVDGSTIQVNTSAVTVGAALAQIGIPLQGLDYSIPAENEDLPADGVIRVVRVTEEVVINQETIPYGSELQPDPEMELDQFRVIQAGQVGLKAERVRVRFEDGVEVARQVEDEWVAREPVNRIQGYGTKIVIRTVETADGVIEYWRAVQMHATSYSPCRSAGEPGRCYPSTSLGLPVEKGVVAVIYDWFIPMGWHTVYVPGYGHAVIADVGGGIPGEYWIDLGYSDDDYVPWSEWVTVYFTTPIPPADEIVYILISN